jgi:hypothetical protein
MGYQQQKGYPEHLPELIGRLADYIKNRGDVECVVHGGDLVDRTDDTCLELAGLMRDLPVPFYLCLGNHDTTVPDALSQWLAAHPDYFPGGAPDYSIALRDAVVHVMPTQWSADLPPYSWERELSPQFLPEQLTRLEQAVQSHAGVPQVVCTHSPVFAVPDVQTGLGAPFHEPPAAFTDIFRELRRRYPCVRLLLSAHNHVNSCRVEGGLAALTGSSFSETPFEFKVVTLDAAGLSLHTETLADTVSFPHAYDFDKTYVQGRRCDRHVEIAF